MPCRLLVKNLSNQYSMGDVVSVHGGDHVFGRYESLIVFENSGLTEWPKQFVIVTITDADMESVLYLVENNSNEERRYYITPQGVDSPHFPDLYNYGEATITMAELTELLIDRGE